MRLTKYPLVFTVLWKCKVNKETPCQLVHGPRVSLEGLHSGTHKITVNVVRSHSGDATAIHQERNPLTKTGSSSAPPSITHAQYTATILGSDTVLVDVVGPGWQGADEIGKRRARLPPPSGNGHETVDQGGSSTADVGGVSGGGKEDTFGDEGVIRFAGSDSGCDDGIRSLTGGCMGGGVDKPQADEKLGAGLAGADDGWYSRTDIDGPKQFDNAELQEEPNDDIGVIRIAIVSNTLEDHSQNRAFAKLCAGLSISK